MEPEHVKEDWQKDEEWTKERMRPLESGLANLQLNVRSSAPTSPIEDRRYNNSAHVSYSEMAVSSSNSITDNRMRRVSSFVSTPNVQQTSLLQQQKPLIQLKVADDLTQLQAIHILHKIRNGEVSAISRSDLICLTNMINMDIQIFAKVDMLDGVFFEYF